MNYHEWVKDQNEAVKEMHKYWDEAKLIANKKNKKKYLEECKHDFTTKWSQKFYEARMRGDIS